MGVELDLSRPFGTRDLLASNPALKRWAILACPFWTAKQRPFGADNTARSSNSGLVGNDQLREGESRFRTGTSNPRIQSAAEVTRRIFEANSRLFSASSRQRLL